MGAEREAEERVGRITIRAGARPEASDYRRPALSHALDIERSAIPFSPTRSQMAVIAIVSLLSLAFTAFMYVATSMVVIAWVPLIALGLVVALAYQRGRLARVAIRGGAVAVSRPWRREQIPLDRIEGLGVGLDAPYSTVWVTVRERGRVLLLDGLTKDEADLVSRRLRDVIAPSA